MQSSAHVLEVVGRPLESCSRTLPDPAPGGILAGAMGAALLGGYRVAQLAARGRSEGKGLRPGAMT